MSNFNHLQHNEDTATVDIGAGLRWDNVYDLLNPKGYTVVGGRVRGVGVAGFILGGGTFLVVVQTVKLIQTSIVKAYLG